MYFPRDILLLDCQWGLCLPTRVMIRATLRSGGAIQHAVGDILPGLGCKQQPAHRNHEQPGLHHDLLLQRR
jgi:hypothetical protein